MWQGFHAMVIAANHIVIIDERVNDCFFHPFYRRGEERVHRIIWHGLDCSRGGIGIGRVRIRRGKCHKQIAGTVSGNAPRARQAKRSAPRQSFQLMEHKRRISSDYNNNRTGILFVNRTWKFFAHRNADDGQLRPAPAIRLYDHANGVGLWQMVRLAIGDRRYRNDARRSTRAALELVTNHSRAAANTPLLDRATMGDLDGVGHVFGLKVKSSHIIAPAVPYLAYHTQTPAESLSNR